MSNNAPPKGGLRLPVPFARGERLLPYASLADKPMPVYVNRVRETFDLRMHAHDFIEICLVAEGSGFHYLEAEQIAVARGDLFFIPVGLSHVLRPAASGQPLVMYNCVVTADRLNALLQAAQAEPELTAFYAARSAGKGWFQLHDRGEEAQRLFHRLHREFTERQPGCSAALGALTVELLILLYRHGIAAGSGTDGGPRQPASPASAPESIASIGEVLAYIRDNCAADLRAAGMAAKLGIGERQFQRSFKQAAGATFLDYVQSARIDLSCRLLLETADKISVVAARSGYRDTKFFNRLFRKKTGVTPRQYRLSGQLPERLGE